MVRTYNEIEPRENDKKYERGGNGEKQKKGKTGENMDATGKEEARKEATK